MSKNDLPTSAPLLVLVRDDESGWAHAAIQPQNSAKAPQFTGFMHTTTTNELVNVMRGAGYSSYATYPIDDTMTTLWFGPSQPPTPPSVFEPPARPATVAA